MYTAVHNFVMMQSIYSQLNVSQRLANLNRTFISSKVTQLIVPMHPHSIHPIRRVCTQVTVGTRNGMASDMFRRRCPSLSVGVGAAWRRVRRFARAPFRDPLFILRFINRRFVFCATLCLSCTVPR